MELFYKKYIIIFLSIILLSSCQKKQKLVIYTSVDQVYSSKIFKDFEQSTGIKILPVYDTEASKAVGLEKRLIMEKKSPKADIFWNSESLRTSKLANLGLFDSIKTIDTSKYKDTIYYDPQKRWFGIGERYRVIIANKKTNNSPKKLEDIFTEENKMKIAISNPLIGTASTHFAALYCKMGKDKFLSLINKIRQSKVQFLAGNSVVKDAVVNGKYKYGIVDSDDALVAIKANKPIKIIYYNQNSDGVFKIFGTIAKLKNAPHPNEAKIFLEYLLTKKVEKKLINMGAVQDSVFKKNNSIKSWSLPPDKINNCFKKSLNILKSLSYIRISNNYV